MSFTDQMPFVVTADNAEALRRVRHFACSVCGRVFVNGDTARWVYANGTPGAGTGNFFVCVTCDGDGVIQRAKESRAQAVKMAMAWNIYGPDWDQH